jgi:hypothetical protein
VVEDCSEGEGGAGVEVALDGGHAGGVVVQGEGSVGVGGLVDAVAAVGVEGVEEVVGDCGQPGGRPGVGVVGEQGVEGVGVVVQHLGGDLDGGFAGDVEVGCGEVSGGHGVAEAFEGAGVGVGDRGVGQVGGGGGASALVGEDGAGGVGGAAVAGGAGADEHESGGFDAVGDGVDEDQGGVQGGVAELPQVAGVVGDGVQVCLDAGQRPAEGVVCSVEGVPGPGLGGGGVEAGYPVAPVAGPRTGAGAGA